MCDVWGSASKGNICSILNESYSTMNETTQIYLLVEWKQKTLCYQVTSEVDLSNQLLFYKEIEKLHCKRKIHKCKK